MGLHHSEPVNIGSALANITGAVTALDIFLAQLLVTRRRRTTLEISLHISQLAPLAGRLGNPLAPSLHELTRNNTLGYRSSTKNKNQDAWQNVQQ